MPVMLDPRWQRGLRALRDRRLLFEVQVFPEQMADMTRVAADHPDNTFVLLHAGMLVDRSNDGIAAWRTALQRFAQLSNTLVRLSGLGTFVRRCTVTDWGP